MKTENYVLGLILGVSIVFVKNSYANCKYIYLLSKRQQIFAMHIVTFKVGLRFLQRPYLRLVSPGMRCRVFQFLVSNVTEEYAASIFREQVDPCRMKQ